jgi:hypothetical protein
MSASDDAETDHKPIGTFRLQTYPEADMAGLSSLRTSSLLIVTAQSIEVAAERRAVRQLSGFWFISGHNLARDMILPNLIWLENLPATITLLPICGTIDLDDPLGLTIALCRSGSPDCRDNHQRDHGDCNTHRHTDLVAHDL